MKINESGRLSSIRAYNAGVQAAENKASLNGKSMKKDKISISSEAKELLEAQKLNEGGRAEKIEALKQSVQEGTYRVSAERLAEKLYPFLK